MKSIDKTAWQTTLSYYRAWNEAKKQTAIQNARQKSPTQKWHEFLALMEFGLKLKPSPSEHEHKRKVAMLNQYYENIRKFEQWRKRHGESASERTTTSDHVP